MKYDEIVRKVCGDNWRTANNAERDGGHGLACVLAYLRGVRPNLSDLSTHLQVRPDEIVAPFNRLNRNGVFESSFGLRQDADFLGTNGEIAEDRAKSHVAAIASGFIGDPNTRIE